MKVLQAQKERVSFADVYNPYFSRKRKTQIGALLDRDFSTDLLCILFYLVSLLMGRLRINRVGRFLDLVTDSNRILMKSSKRPFFRVYDGYWQDEEVISPTICQVRDWLVAQVPTDVFQKLKSYLEDAVCVHIRRGDYLASGSIHAVLSPEYYSLAISRIMAQPKKGLLSKIVVISESVSDGDLGLSKLGLPVHRPLGIIAPPEINDLCLVMLSSAVVCANSTFSWWGSLLNERGGIIIYPREWFLGGSGLGRKGWLAL